jgi:hypothetical protein
MGMKMVVMVGMVTQMVLKEKKVKNNYSSSSSPKVIQLYVTMMRST